MATVLSKNSQRREGQAVLMENTISVQNYLFKGTENCKLWYVGSVSGQDGANPKLPLAT